MLNGYKLIGVCVTRIQDEFSTEFLQALHENAVAEDYRLLVFNSFLDFYTEDSYARGAKSIYKLINFDLIDVLIIIDHCFYDKRVVERLIEKAKAKNVPVIVMYGSYDGCFSIIKDYRDTYIQLIKHVIDVHGAKKLKFIAGVKGEYNSDLRLKSFYETMSEKGISVGENDVVWCDYWNVPVYNAIDEWIAQGGLPQAIICANDSMASAACDHLIKNGINVPEDIIVTGFDGLQSLAFHKPRLTTCVQETAETARLCFKMVRGAVEDGTEPYTEKEKFVFNISESCGCRIEPDLSYREKAARLYALLEDTAAHENIIYAWADRISETTDIGVIGMNLSQNILPGSAMIINSNLLSTARKNAKTDPDHPFTEKMIIIASRAYDYTTLQQDVFDSADMVPSFNDQISDRVMFVFQSIYTGDEVCGFYMMKMGDAENVVNKLHRLCRIVNLDFGIILNRIKKEHVTSSVDSLITRDALTGLLNLKGLVNQIKDNYEEYSKKSIAVSIYAIPQYKFIMENFGLEEVEESVNLTADALQLSNPVNSLISRISDDEFIIVNIIDSPDAIGDTISRAVRVFYEVIEDYNRNGEKDYFTEVSCGCVVSTPGWDNDIMSFIKAANGEMYLNRMKQGKSPVLKPERSQEKNYRIFELLIQNNLFRYHFQPIIDAHSGEVYAYEALMRTDDSINLNPGQILSIAEEYGRMYEIEHATLFNIMEYVDKHSDEFENRRVFINTIPGCFLNETDYAELVKLYGHIFNRCTIEITEQGETDDAELMQIKRFESNGEFCQLAIDDYGTGFSNIVNLLRYQPQVIKIDRYLITDVHKDTNKQLFIKSTVDFAKLNDIQVLAEGVETIEELGKVIELGVDLIQGYYTARPSAEIIKEINPDTKKFIVEKSLKAAKSRNSGPVYTADDGEILKLSELSEYQFTTLLLGSGSYTVIGTPEEFFNIEIFTAKDARNEILFENVNLHYPDHPTLVIGEGGNTVVTLRGSSFLNEEGIRVPHGASLTIDGDGDLRIKSICKTAVSLGGDLNQSFGNIVIDMSGSLSIESSGDNPVCIGGGFGEKGTSINIKRGKLELISQGVEAVGIGCMTGCAEVSIGSAAEIKLVIAGNESVAIGSLNGDTDITTGGKIYADCEGAKTAGIGILEGGEGRVCFTGGEVDSIIHGADSCCIGSVKGRVKIACHDTYINAYGEGGSACALGNRNGRGVIAIDGGRIKADLRSGSPIYVGGERDTVIITSGNITVENGDIDHAVNALGDPIYKLEIIGAVKYESEISTSNGNYVYKAEKRGDDDRLCVYLPQEYLR